MRRAALSALRGTFDLPRTHASRHPALALALRARHGACTCARSQVAAPFLEKLLAKVAALKAGLPWEEGVSITPLPEPKKPEILTEMIADAVANGAVVANAEAGGGEVRGALVTP